MVEVLLVLEIFITEDYIRTNRAYQLVKHLTTVKQGKATTVQDRSGKCLTEQREIPNRWTESALSCTTTRPMEIHQNCYSEPVSYAVVVSHPSEVMLKIILNRSKPQAEKIIAEEQAGFTAGSSTTEQIVNLRSMCGKYIQHQQDLHHVFVDFKTAFLGVWHAALWATIKKYNISTNLIRIIKNLYGKVTSAVLFNSIGDWLRTKVGVRQECLLSSALFNIFLGKTR